MTITIMMPFTPAYQAQVRAIAPDAQLHFVGDTPPTRDILAASEVIIGNPSLDELKQCTALKWLQLRTAGADMYQKEGVLKQGVTLTNASGGYGTAISEYLLAVTLSLCKQLHRYRDQQLSQLWKPISAVRSLSRQKALVVGLGDIGSQYARKLHALGATVRGIRRNVGNTPDYLEGLCTLDALDEWLPWADIVALCLPASTATEGLFSQAQFNRMKQGAFLINIGRGVLVDTEALVSALTSGHLGGAALDVTEPEPLPPGHPLWQLPNVILTPHSAGGDYFGVIYDDTIAVCLNNLKRYVQGDALLNVVGG